MAMGGRGQREAQAAIASCRPFSNSTGSLRGTRGSTRQLGFLEGKATGRELATVKDLLSRAVYVVWSYNTPIGCTDEDGINHYFDYSYSTTTSHHQTILRVGFSDFETIGQGPWSRVSSRQRNSRAEVQGAVRYFEPRGPEPVRRPTEEDHQREQLAALLDPRYLDPDWVPFTGCRGGLPSPEADFRDEARVLEDLRQYRNPAHP